MSNSGLDPQKDESFLDEEPDFDQSIDEWLTDVKRRSEKGKDEKTESERANPYRLEKFYKHLCTLVA